MAFVDPFATPAPGCSDAERGMTMHLRHAAGSMPSNIAEGAARRSTEYLRFVCKDPLDRTFARLDALIRTLDSESPRLRQEPALLESPIPESRIPC